MIRPRSTAAVARVFDELQSQYTLAFEPAHADGKSHEISVTTKNRDLRVRARARIRRGRSESRVLSFCVLLPLPLPVK